MAQLIERCKTTLARIKNLDARKEYALFFREKIRSLRDAKPDWARAAELLRAPESEQEHKWLDAVRSPFGQRLTAAVLEIDGDLFAVTPILHTFTNLLKGGE